MQIIRIIVGVSSMEERYHFILGSVLMGGKADIQHRRNLGYVAFNNYKKA